jgi:hypothetical protein
MMSSSKTTTKVPPSAVFFAALKTGTGVKPAVSDKDSRASSRFTLQAATSTCSRGKAKMSSLGLSTCNSGFLSSLLADVAIAKQQILQANKRTSATASFVVDDEPIKRRRISTETCSPTAAVQQTNKPLNILDLLWEESWLAPPRYGFALLNHSAAGQRPVHSIPATVSESFQDLDEADTRVVATKPCASTMESEDHFGWFVDMDDDGVGMVCDDSHHCHKPASQSRGSLAFSAPIAPKQASHNDAQVEWAKAADTVDHVLADLF